jgi:hypothetical protein
MKSFDLDQDPVTELYRPGRARLGIGWLERGNIAVGAETCGTKIMSSGNGSSDLLLGRWPSRPSS